MRKLERKSRSKPPKSPKREPRDANQLNIELESQPRASQVSPCTSVILSFVILTSTLSQLPSDVDDTRTRSLSPSGSSLSSSYLPSSWSSKPQTKPYSASDLKEGAVLQQHFSSSIIAATPRSSIHPDPVDYQSSSSRLTTRTSSDVHDPPIPARPFPAQPHDWPELPLAVPRVSRPLEDGPPPPRLRTRLLRKEKKVSSRKSRLKDSANAESNPTTSYTSSVLQNLPKAPPKSSVQRTYYRGHEYDLAAPHLSDMNDYGGQSSKSAPPLGKTETPITPSAALIPTQNRPDIIRVRPINSSNLAVSIFNPWSQPPSLPGDTQNLATSSDKSLFVSHCSYIDY